MFVCVYMWTASLIYMHMSIVTAVNEYTLGFTHISNCPTISDVTACAILYNTLGTHKFICTYIRM